VKTKAVDREGRKLNAELDKWGRWIEMCLYCIKMITVETPDRSSGQGLIDGYWDSLTKEMIDLIVTRTEDRSPKEKV
jgi:hypothetical protein